MFGILADLGVGHIIHGAVIKEIVDHGTDQHFEGCRRADAGSADYIGGYIGVETIHLISHFGSGFKNTHEKCIGAAVGAVLIQVFQIQCQILVVVFADDVYQVCSVGSGSCHCIHGDASGQDFSVIMVCVVAQDLCSSRCGKIIRRSFLEAAGKGLMQMRKAGLLCDYIFFAVDLCEYGFCFLCVKHDKTSLYFLTVTVFEL